MDNYTVKVSPRARCDLEQIYAYISGHLMEPNVAKNMIDLLVNGIYSLEHMPERNPVRRIGSHANRGYRQLFVKNYVIIYLVRKTQKEVYVMTVRYASSQF